MAARRFCRICSVVLVVVVSSSSSALSATRIEIEREPVSIHVDTTLSDVGSEATLRVKVLAPDEDGSRFVWQTCSFPSAGSGSYRCPIDRAAAEKRPGEWVARAILDDERVGRRAFWVR